MTEKRIAKSTGEIDGRTLNGNSGVKRGKDVGERKRRVGYYRLKDEVKAMLAHRLEMLIEAYGGVNALAKSLKYSHQVVQSWRKNGMVSVEGARRAHQKYSRYKIGYRASFIRPDLQFDNNGKAKTARCVNRKMMMVVTHEDLKIRDAIKAEQEAERLRKKEVRDRKREEKIALAESMAALKDKI